MAFCQCRPSTAFETADSSPRLWCERPIFGPAVSTYHMDSEAVTPGHVEEEVPALSNLDTSRTPYAFVSRLPTETLQDIFIHCAQNYHYQHLCPTKSVPNWVNVSYVCRHWRNVALESPTLWAYLFIISRRWTRVLLARSKQESLKMRVSIARRTSLVGLSCVEIVMNHVERIQELRLRLPASFIRRRIFPRLSSRAPRLQDLDIVAESPDLFAKWPSLLFDGDPPALRTLRLAFCPVPLHSSRLSALTVLYLANVPVRFQQNMEEFLAALSHMQDLKHLHLRDAFPSATGFLSSAVFKTFEKIDLTHLSRLLIGAPLSTTVTLLSCINIPLKTQVRLECHSEPNFSLDHYALLLSLLAQRYKDQAQSNPTILSLNIHSTMRGVTLIFSPRKRDTIDMVYETWDHDTPLHIKLNCSMVNRDVIINDVCSSMPLSSAQTLLVMQPIFSPVFWRRLLRQLQDLRCMFLFTGNMPDLSVLSLTDHTTHDPEGEDVQNHGGLAPADRGRSHILAPRLEELELRYITFLPDGGSNLLEPAITRGRLFEVLSTRRLEGCPGRLTMTRCSIPGSVKFDMVAGWGGGGSCYAISEREYSPGVVVEVGFDSDLDLDWDWDSEAEGWQEGEEE